MSKAKKPVRKPVRARPQVEVKVTVRCSYGRCQKTKSFTMDAMEFDAKYFGESISDSEWYVPEYCEDGVLCPSHNDMEDEEVDAEEDEDEG